MATDENADDPTVGVTRLGKPLRQRPDMRDLGLVFTDYNYIWQDVGLQLKLKQVVLGTIAANNPLNQRNCFRETLQKWLQMDVNATWETLELAITNAKRHQLGYGKLTSMSPLQPVNQLNTSYDQADASGGVRKTNMAAAVNHSSEDQNNNPPPNSKPDQQDATDGDGLQVYKMDSNPRGRAIIINNKKIDGKATRNGAEEDGKILKQLFYYLGFTTELHEDKKVAEMEQILKDVAKSDHSGHNCLLVAILSHGEDMEQVYGTDTTVSLIKLFKNFGGSNCESLISKPKIFFVQACRGDEFDEGVVATDGDSNEHDETDLGITLPTMSDYLIAYPTDRNSPAFRSSIKGSYFIRDLDEVFRKMAEKEQLIDMLTEVNRKMAERTFQGGKYKQQPHFVSALRKKLYLHPVPKPSEDQLDKVLQSQPKMYELQQIIFSRIKESWKDVAFALHYEPRVVKDLEIEHKKDAEICCRELFEDWLTYADHGISPKTWFKLLEAIRSVPKLKATAVDISKDVAAQIKIK